jgi:microcystin-dependent protein
MSQPFVGEIRMFGGNFAPAGWQFCNGQLLAISEFSTLFNLIGTTYGGDGTSTFALPDLRGRLPVHQGTGLGLSTYVIGQNGGTETVQLNSLAMPSHQHNVVATTSTATSNLPSNALFAATPVPTPGASAAYATGSPSMGTLQPATVQTAGGNVAHDNLMPFLCVSFIISMFGVFPSQN